MAAELDLYTGMVTGVFVGPKGLGALKSAFVAALGQKSLYLRPGDPFLVGYLSEGLFLKPNILRPGL